MIQLLNILKNNISDKLLFEEQSEANQFLTKYFSGLTRIKDLDGHIFATNDNKEIVAYEQNRTGTFLLNKKIYDEFPDFVKFGLKEWVSDEFWLNLKVTSFYNEGCEPILDFLKKRNYINKFINFNFLKLMLYELDTEIYFVDLEEDKPVALISLNEVYIEKNMYNTLKSLFNLNDDFVVALAFRNWFNDFYGYNIGLVNQTLFNTGFITQNGKLIGPVKDNLKNI